MIVVLDTNIWVSLAFNRQLEFIDLIVEKGITIASCDQLLSELNGVLLRPKFKKYFSNSYIRSIIQYYQLATTSFELTEIDMVVTDHKDNYLFALCKVSNADHFVTGDKLLLDVDKYDKTSIITLAAFKNIL